MTICIVCILEIVDVEYCDRKSVCVPLCVKNPCIPIKRCPVSNPRHSVFVCQTAVCFRLHTGPEQPHPPPETDITERKVKSNQANAEKQRIITDLLREKCSQRKHCPGCQYANTDQYKKCVFVVVMKQFSQTKENTGRNCTDD